MTELIDLLEGKPVFLDDRTADLGGSFYRNPDVQPYSPLPLKWAWEQLIRYEHAVMLDVGSSTGCFALLSRHHPDLKVWAFEPVDLTFQVLKQNIYLNGLTKKAFPHKLAVSDYNGKGTLHTVIADGGKGVSIVDGLPAYHKAVEDSEIDVVTIDTFCALHNIVPTLIKIDVEGNELAVLNGARETIEKYKPYLMFEYSQENADQYKVVVAETILMIEKMGYYWTLPEVDVLAVHKNWQEAIK